METFYGILIPFLGTSLGAACVFFMKKSLSDRVQRSLTGFAAGVMVAASVWSLLIPAIEQSAALGKLSFLPAAIGFWTGVLFLLLLDHTIPQLIVPALPYLLSFAAGAMLYVVVEELIPEMSQGTHSNIGTVFFAVGFTAMMILDVALG